MALGHPVRRIEHGADSVIVHADGADGEPDGLTVRARRAIVAIPPTLAGRIAYDPPLPALRDQLTQRMPQGTVVKTMAIYETPFWREQGLSGQAISQGGPARVVFDNSPPDGTPGVLLGFLEGRLARHWGAGPRPSDARRYSPVTPGSSASAPPGQRDSSSGSGRTRSGLVAATAA